VQTFDLTNNDSLGVPEEVFNRTPADMIRVILALQPEAEFKSKPSAQKATQLEIRMAPALSQVV